MLTYGFYNSLGGDRRYNAEQMSSIFDGIINDGVFASIGDALTVSAGTGMNVVVAIGRAWFNHTWTNNDTALTLPVAASGVGLGRKDIVVLEVNSSEDIRANSIKIIKGTPSGTPALPALTNTETVHQYPLCYIDVAAGVTEIIQANITNKVGSSDCPLITGILETINTDALLAQWTSEYNVWLANIQTLFNETDADVDEKIAGWQLEFDTWFAMIQNILDESTAGNLLNLINANTSDINALELSVGTLTSSVNGLSQSVSDLDESVDTLSGSVSTLSQSISGLDTDIDAKAGRYQAEFGFVGLSSINCGLTNDVLNLDAVTSNTTTSNNSADEDVFLYAGNGTGQRLDGTFTASMDSITRVNVLIESKTGTPPSLKVSIFDETTGVELGSKTTPQASLTTSWNTVTFDSPINIVRGHVIQIRMDTAGLGDTNNKYNIRRAIGGNANQANAFNITTSNSWTSKTDNTTKDLSYTVTYQTKSSSGTATKTIAPNDVNSYGTLKVIAASVSANNTATVTIKDASDNILIASTPLVNGVNNIDLSSINSTTYTSIKTVFGLTRASASDTSATISKPSWSWEGRPKKIIVVAADAASIVIPINPAHARVFLKTRLVNTNSSGYPKTLNMKFNDDSGSNYIWSYSTLAAGGTFTGAAPATGSIMSLPPNCVPGHDASYYHNSIMNIEICNDATRQKTVNAFGNCTPIYQSDYPFKYPFMYGGVWINKVNAITSITLSLDADNIKAGSIIEVWGCP